MCLDRFIHFNQKVVGVTLRHIAHENVWLHRNFETAKQNRLDQESLPGESICLTLQRPPARFGQSHVVFDLFIETRLVAF